MSDYKNVTKRKVTKDTDTGQVVKKVSPVLEEKKNNDKKADRVKWVMPSWAGYIIPILIGIIIFTKFKTLALWMILTLIGVGLAMAVLLDIISRKKRAYKKKALEGQGDIFPKDQSEEVIVKLRKLKDSINSRIKKVKKDEVKKDLSGLELTLGLMADEVERDPKDRKKVRKIANYYGDMLLQLIDKYISFQDKDQTIENVAESMMKIEEGIKGASESLKKALNELFSEDVMEVNADVNALEQLIKIDKI